MSFIRQRPVMFWGTLTTLASGIVGLLVIFEVVTMTAEQVAQIMLVLAAIGQMFIFLIQGQVTPTADPKDDAGNSLTPGPIGDDQPTI